jgi:hypothetical protein
MRWNHSTARALIASHFPDFLSIYDGYKTPVMRADAARILILAVHGGVYLDADIECLRNGEDMLAGRDVVLQMGGCTCQRVLKASSCCFPPFSCLCCFPPVPCICQYTELSHAST